jgi:spore coat protein U-like protein
LDPTSGSAATGVVSQPTFWCTNGTSYTLSDNDGLNASAGAQRMVGTSAANLGQFIPYSFSYSTTGAGTGKSTPITMDIAATVANASFINATAGAYSDTVTITINP